MLSRREGSFLKLMKERRELDSSLKTHTEITTLKEQNERRNNKNEKIEDEQWMKHATHRGDLSQPNPRDE